MPLIYIYNISIKRILCNPWIFAHAHALFSKTANDGSNSEYQEVLASLMDYLSLSEEKSKIVFVKLPIFCMPQGKVINKIYPTVNHICIVGHTQSSIHSFYEVTFQSRIFFYKEPNSAVSSFHMQLSLIIYRSSVPSTSIYIVTMSTLSFGPITCHFLTNQQTRMKHISHLSAIGLKGTEKTTSLVLSV